MHQHAMTFCTLTLSEKKMDLALIDPKKPPIKVMDTANVNNYVFV